MPKNRELTPECTFPLDQKAEILLAMTIDGLLDYGQRLTAKQEENLDIYQNWTGKARLRAFFPEARVNRQYLPYISIFIPAENETVVNTPLRFRFPYARFRCLRKGVDLGVNQPGIIIRPAPYHEGPLVKLTDPEARESVQALVDLLSFSPPLLVLQKQIYVPTACQWVDSQYQKMSQPLAETLQS